MRVRTHPGEVLKEEFMLPMELSANALAMALGVPVTRISDIIHFRRSVTADTAARLARYFGTSSQFWMHLQTAYDLSVVEAEKEADLLRIIPFAPLPRTRMTRQANA